ncbi:NAC domain-containing protein 91-like [Mangifera indica]|uniref:NAC domain-containing protein 91-like n=1 Tax=Mangifera indica TaxID=29780 RepID=UPI001CF9D3FE|nr:NAC domain-containing protein 91-like [Mangifera indica]
MDYFNGMGYRFHPTEDEIIHHFLESKMRDGTDFSAVIKEVDICSFEPWQLPEHSPLSSDDQQWYFFSAIAYKYAKSKRIERTTRAGSWKVTGKDREIYDENTGQLIGKRKALVFYQGHGSNAVKTCWAMHEFHSETARYYQKPFVLCRLKRKSDDTEDDQPSSRWASTSRN